ncbi:hypothetical protein K503DRAFT_344787 [Rhizopogon vinicolor AM-OR11-026]|uniref:Uncharacterized protein n=1 Tax=Rhizopogon vinicolor AM-OR11-026 TaxID=1314800 RepID=A0A1B7MT37_9AGAM|nr:hypothetical protein K503DRAFT_344787 [Rhizopogon vinicolor AM-OR11-026]
MTWDKIIFPIMSDSLVPCTPITYINVDATYGPQLGGLFCAFMFYGANCVQVFVYLVNYPDDKISHKAMVAAAWTTDTAHQILGAVGVWQYLITGFGKYDYLEKNNVPLFMALICSVIVSTIAQLFLTRRIWQLSGRFWVFPAFLIPASVSQLGR